MFEYDLVEILFFINKNNKIIQNNIYKVDKCNKNNIEFS